MRPRLLPLALLVIAGCDAFGGGGMTLSAPGEVIGEAVALDGDVALLGAPGSAEAFVFERDAAGAWSAPVTLRPTTGLSPDPFFGFGHFLALDGDVAVVGAPEFSESDDAAGHAYVYTRDDGAWTEAADLRPDDLTPNAGFGSAVAVSGGRVAVAAGSDGCTELTDRGCGRIHIFDAEAGWARTAVLSVPDDAPWFATGLALDADRLVVFGMEGAFGNQGRVYAYRLGDAGWALTEVFDGPPLPDGSFTPLGFGIDSALNGETLAVTEAGRDGGTVYVYRLGAGARVPEAVLTRPFDPETGPRRGLGRNLDLDGDRLIVSAPHTEYNGRLRGTAVVYVRDERGTWTEEAELRPAGGEVGFGRDVAIDGETALVGANRASDGSGGAHVFLRLGGEWIEDR